jgi:hypothetical protein
MTWLLDIYFFNLSGGIDWYKPAWLAKHEYDRAAKTLPETETPD